MLSYIPGTLMLVSHLQSKHVSVAQLASHLTLSVKALICFRLDDEVIDLQVQGMGLE